jgi:hypothetical protein
MAKTSKKTEEIIRLIHWNYRQKKVAPISHIINLACGFPPDADMPTEPSDPRYEPFDQIMKAIDSGELQVVWPKEH